MMLPHVIVDTSLCYRHFGLLFAFGHNFRKVKHGGIFLLIVVHKILIKKESLKFSLTFSLNKGCVKEKETKISSRSYHQGAVKAAFSTHLLIVGALYCHLDETYLKKRKK